MNNLVKVGICAATFVLSLSAMGCSAGADPANSEFASEGADLGSTEQAWAPIACGRETTLANATFAGKIENTSDPQLQHVSPQSYNTCYKSYVVDVSNLSASYTGPGAGGGEPAYFEIVWRDTVPTNATTCQEAFGGAIVYQRVGNAWVDLTGQMTSSGTWAQDPWGNWRCYTPGVRFYNAVAGGTYRIAATMRNGLDATRKVGIRTVPPTIIH